ncbi:TetR/AcrR family transcriptional regulator [Catonella massiliensis]|jgi:transcriptional regulator, TetR family|uniref:TetR/AcrR family transcriptional regulator n=1 Tax=Catonella massiliensis TaxID=2799636 RepID=A0ABS1IYD0_9FIRM|nr:TetR/AcrR family transcriptional regulator [Catonella massiliensis]MBK5896906.1 TetR/AcrR family transcriptional regulator [Catonella massiliensis]
MKKGERRKQDLLNIAYRMFIEKGYENTSVDDIIIEAGIAKGTYYYYFESKEATLEAVIEMMIEKAENIAKAALMNPVPIPQKLASVVYAFQPNKDEIVITDVLERKENIVMHDKIGKKIVEVAVPILSDIVREGIAQGIFACTNVEERVKMLLIMSQNMFDYGAYSNKDIEVYVDMLEKSLGAKEGIMSFISEFLLEGQVHSPA